MAIESYLACEQVQLELEVTASQKRVLDKVLEESKAFSLKLREVPLLNYDKQLKDETRQHLVEQLNGAFIETQVERFYQLQDWYDLRRLGVLHFLAIRSGNQKLLQELLPWHKQLQEEFAARHEKDYQQLVDELLQPLSKEQRETILNDKWFSIPTGLEVLILSLEQASKRAIENPDGDISLLEMALFGGLYHQLDYGGTWNSVYHSPARLIGTSESARRMINDQVLDVPIEVRQELKLRFRLQQQREVDIKSRAAKIYLETGSNEAREYQRKTLRESRSDFAKELQELLTDPTLSPALEYLAAENSGVSGLC